MLLQKPVVELNSALQQRKCIRVSGRVMIISSVMKKRIEKTYLTNWEQKQSIRVSG